MFSLGKYKLGFGLTQSSRNGLSSSSTLVNDSKGPSPNMEGPPRLSAPRDLLENMEKVGMNRDGVFFHKSSQPLFHRHIKSSDDAKRKELGEKELDECSRSNVNDRLGYAENGQHMDIGIDPHDMENAKAGYDISAGISDGIYQEFSDVCQSNECLSVNEKYESSVGSYAHKSMVKDEPGYGADARKSDGIYKNVLDGCMSHNMSLYSGNEYDLHAGSYTRGIHVGMLAVDNRQSDNAYAATVESFEHNKAYIFSLTGGCAAKELRKRSLLDDDLNAGDTGWQDKTADYAQQYDEVPIHTQVVTFVKNAKEAYIKLKAAVDTANGTLKNFNQLTDQVPADILDVVKMHLTDDPDWLLSILESKQRTIEALQREAFDVRELCNTVIVERDGLKEKLEGVASKPKRLSLGEQERMDAMGIKSVSDLLTKHRKLQVQMQELNETNSVRGSLSRVSSLSTVAENQDEEEWPPMHQSKSKVESFILNGNVKRVNGRAHDSLPMPKKFEGKTRLDLERWLRYFDQAVNSRRYTDDDKATMLGNYIPKLLFHHDKLVKKGASYAEIKAGLLNAMGSDSSAATFTLRTSLDRVTKADDKLYKDLLEDVERKVSQAYSDDGDQGDSELKKILIRLTQEDSNPIFGSTVIPHIDENYTRLKELVLAVEASLIVKKKVDGKLKHHNKACSTTDSKRTPYFQQHYNQSNPFSSNDCRSVNGKAEKIVDESSRKEQERFSLSSSSNDNLSRKPYVCYKCSKPGHYATDCPEHNARGVRQIESLQELELNGLVPIGNVGANEAEDVIMFGRKALLDVWLDSIKVNAMIDSGASASVISVSAIGKILRQRNKIVRRITEEDPKTFMHKQLVGANGVILNVVNCVRMPISWGSYPSKVAKFFVVSELQQDVLIGTNVLQNDPVWIEALGVALGIRSTNTNGYAKRNYASVGLILPRDNIKCNPDSSFYCNRAVSRDYCNVKRDVKKSKVQQQTSKHQQMKETKNRNPRHQELPNDYGQLPKTLNGRRVFYNQLFYYGRERNIPVIHDQPKPTLNENERTSNVRGNGRRSSTPTQLREKLFNRGSTQYRGRPDNRGKRISRETSLYCAPVSIYLTRDDRYRDLTPSTRRPPQQ